MWPPCGSAGFGGAGSANDNLRLRSGFLRLFGDDGVFDLVVCCLWHDFLRNKLVFCAIGAACNDFVGDGVTYAGYGIELFFGGGIDVYQCSALGF